MTLSRRELLLRPGTWSLPRMAAVGQSDPATAGLSPLLMDYLADGLAVSYLKVRSGAAGAGDLRVFGQKCKMLAEHYLESGFDAGVRSWAASADPASVAQGNNAAGLADAALVYLHRHDSTITSAEVASGIPSVTDAAAVGRGLAWLANYGVSGAYFYFAEAAKAAARNQESGADLVPTRYDVRGRRPFFCEGQQYWTKARVCEWLSYGAIAANVGLKVLEKICLMTGGPLDPAGQVCTAVLASDGTTLALISLLILVLGC